MIVIEFDELNINILSYLYINPNSTTSKITKNILDSKDINDFRKNDSIIRYRIKTMEKSGLLYQTKHKKTSKYSLNNNFVIEICINGESIPGILFLVEDKYPIFIGFNKKLIKSL